MVNTFPAPVLNSLAGGANWEGDGSDEQADTVINTVPAASQRLASPAMQPIFTL
jgi:hypothetical protein